jgi:hypothetical protein
MTARPSPVFQIRRLAFEELIEQDSSATQATE